MGYYTDFTLKIEGPEEMIQEMRESEFKSETDYGPLFNNFYLREAGLYYWTEVKWYEYREDMERISKRNPDLFFTLWGDGEEGGDLWVAYFYQGASERFEARIIYPGTTFEFDA